MIRVKRYGVFLRKLRFLFSYAKLEVTTNTS